MLFYSEEENSHAYIEVFIETTMTDATKMTVFEEII